MPSSGRGYAGSRQAAPVASARRGRVVAFVGSNLMKFGPLLGELLAEAMVSDALPADLVLN
ncbi:hypothetical protein H7H80_09970 [Mycobacterium interjectum]|nr:hypothetical protein [Mycobacterium interjectum]